MQKLANKRASVEALSTEDVLRILAEARAETAKLQRAVAAFASVMAGETSHYSMKVIPAEYAGRRKVWRSLIKTIPGAVNLKTGEGKPSRFWSVSRERYAAWLDAQSETPAPAPLAVKPALVKAWTPADALEGLRAVGGSK